MARKQPISAEARKEITKRTETVIQHRHDRDPLVSFRSVR